MMQNQLKIIRLPELLQLISVSRATIRRWELAKKFPVHFKLGENSVGWLLSDVEKWLANQAKGGSEYGA
jgi:prophage regulatory protein